jgi:replicative DNA helicase
VSVIREIVSPDDFSDVNLQGIIRAAYALHARGKPVDVWTIKWEIEETGGRCDSSLLAEAASMIPTAAHAAHYAWRVHDLAGRRRMLIEAQNIAQQAIDGQRRQRPKPGGVLL